MATAKKRSNGKTKPKPRSKKPAWEIMMSVINPSINRARFFSLNTIATMIGRRDLKRLFKQLQTSGKVIGQFCPIVQAPVFYLRDKYSRSYGHYSSVWQSAWRYIEEYPFPKVKGFRASYGYWAGDRWGNGKWVRGTHEMKSPFIKDDYAYANEIIKALKAAGYKPRIKPYKIGKTL